MAKQQPTAVAPAPQSSRITANGYFCGAGGMIQGLVEAGIHVQQSLELHPDRVATLKANHSHAVVHADICGQTVLDQPPADIIVGTYPCKRYSTIADIHKTRTGDDLYLHFFRHVVLFQPEMFILENVPGMRKFAVVMECFTKLPNYFIRVECPVSATCWLPQKRDRVIIFGTRKPMNPRSPETRGAVPMASILEREPQVHIPDYVYKRLRGGYRDKPIIVKRDGIAPTCVAHYGRDRSTRLVEDPRFPHGVRPFTVREYARLQGFPDSYVFCGDERSQYEQIGDAVPVAMARWAGVEAMRYFGRV